MKHASRSTLLALGLGLGSALASLPGCGGAPVRPTGLDPGRLEPSNLYPMREGYVWSYDVDTGTGMRTFAVSRVLSVSGGRVAITNGGEEILYELRDGGIFRPQSGTWLLRAPIEVGASWPSSGDTTARVTSVTETVEVPGGRFEGCVEVLEEGGEGARRVRTVYCAGVGPTIVESRQELALRPEPLVVRGELIGLVRGAEDAEEPEGYDAPPPGPRSR
jgi:hypothetical protein